MTRILVLAVLLAGCAASLPVPVPISRPPPDPVPAPVVRKPAPSPTVATLSPAEIIVAAEQARRDAAGYVAWKNSKAANIDRLTTLTTTLGAAVKQMQAGRNRPTDVLAARSALLELRSFLMNKGD